MNQCFDCNQDASGRFTIDFEDGKVLGAEWVCRECLNDFQATKGIEVTQIRKAEIRREPEYNS